MGAFQFEPVYPNGRGYPETVLFKGSIMGLPQGFRIASIGLLFLHRKFAWCIRPDLDGYLNDLGIRDGSGYLMSAD